MSEPTTAARHGRPSIHILLGLALAGCVLSAILTLESYNVGHVCGDHCAGALASADAKLFGLPAALLGLGWYAFLAALCLSAALPSAERGGWPSPPWSKGLAAAGGLGLAASAWFTAKMLSAAGVIPAGLSSESYDLCPLCLATHSVGLLFFLVALFAHVLAGAKLEEADDAAPRPPNLVFVQGMAIACLAGALAVVVPDHLRVHAAVAWHEKTLEELKLVPGVAQALLVADMEGFDPVAFEKALAADVPPTWGSKEAPLVVREFVDASCGHCLAMMRDVRQIVDDSKGLVRFEFLFYPGEKSCNPHIRELRRYTSCDVAHGLAAALSLGGEEKFWQMVGFFYDPTMAPLRPDWERWSRALELDWKQFDAAMRSEEIRRRVRRDVDLGAKVPVKEWPTVLVGTQVLNKNVTALDVDKVLQDGFRRLDQAALAKYQGVVPPGMDSHANHAAHGGHDHSAAGAGEHASHGAPSGGDAPATRDHGAMDGHAGMEGHGDHGGHAAHGG